LAERLTTDTQTELQTSGPAPAGPGNAAQTELDTTRGAICATALTAEQSTAELTTHDRNPIVSLTSEQATALNGRWAESGAGPAQPHQPRAMRAVQGAAETSRIVRAPGWSSKSVRVCPSLPCTIGRREQRSQFPEESGPRLPRPTRIKDCSPIHFAEIGGQPPEVRMNLAALVHEGQLRLTQRAIRDKAKELKSQAAKVGLEAVEAVFSQKGGGGQPPPTIPKELGSPRGSP
jgi:hypothetical protein